MNTKDVQQHLKEIGFPIAVDGAWGPNTETAVTRFQRGWAFYPLLVDGHAGPQTWKALADCLAKEGKCSQFFRYREFASKGDGWPSVARELVSGLDRYRERYGPTRIVSGYRDPKYNATIPGAAPNSQHKYGNAADLQPKGSVSAVRNLRVFSGIGYQRSTGLVRHVDVRHVGPNTTGGTPAKPTVWVYP